MTLGKSSWWCLGLILLACAASCSNEPRNCSSVNDQGTPVDATLMAFLSRARAAHHLADLKEDEEPLQAVDVLMLLVDGPHPHMAGTTPTEVREVLSDTQARIADLLSREKRFVEALDRIAAALKLVPEPSYFRGHLFETRGLIEQRHAEELKAQGDIEQSEAAKARALQAFELAMEMQAAVIRSAPPIGVPAPQATHDAEHPSPADALRRPSSGEND